MGGEHAFIARLRDNRFPPRSGHSNTLSAGLDEGRSR